MQLVVVIIEWYLCLLREQCSVSAKTIPSSGTARAYFNNFFNHVRRILKKNVIAVDAFQMADIVYFVII
jgi:hypothetical protein